ncbi:MAG: hypothetical protein J4O03_12420 [Chloroflexi bacterium]|nr:hypothetical protein [Chloroflexota bacterium]MCI0794259.1 hypothetical protein [Chloroflexota bacterium]MCI0895011.1 hypothetical protein [Chloroflexota bacterium]
MRTLTLKNTAKNMTLLVAGALMATMIAVPLGGIASADDDDPVVNRIVAPVTYTIEANNGSPSTFELVERDGQMMLVLVSQGPIYTPSNDDDD